MKNRWLAVGILSLIVFLLSCSRQAEILPEQPAAPLVLETDEESEILIPSPMFETEVEAILAKSRTISNYKYTFEAASLAGYEVTLKGDLLKKKYAHPVQYQGELYYNEVYLNTTGRMALAICSKPGVSCAPAWGQVFLLSFDEQMPTIFPLNLILKVPISARVVGSEVFDERRAKIIEYMNDANLREQLAVDAFYGLVLKQTVFEDVDDESTIVEKHTFTDIEAGNVKNSDVTLPASYMVTN